MDLIAAIRAGVAQKQRTIRDMVSPAGDQPESMIVLLFRPVGATLVS